MRIERTLRSDERKKRSKIAQERLAPALSKALANSKKGIRSSDSEVFQLKYITCCSSLAPERFTRQSYSPWRSDCPDTSSGSQADPGRG